MHIRPGRRDDMPDIASVASRAMMEDELSLWLSPQQREFKHIHRQRCLRSTKRRWNAGMTYLVAVTDENDKEWDGISRVVGYAAYEKSIGAPDDTSKRAATFFGGLERFLSRIEEDYIYYFRNNFNTIAERSAEVNRVLSSTKSFEQFKQYWELDILCVDPDYGRRGIGAALIDWGQQRATEDNVPLLLWASRKGRPLYLRKGFVECEMLDFQGALQAPAMVWKPVPREQATSISEPEGSSKGTVATTLPVIAQDTDPSEPTGMLGIAPEEAVLSAASPSLPALDTTSQDDDQPSISGNVRSPVTTPAASPTDEDGFEI